MVFAYYEKNICRSHFDLKVSKCEELCTHVEK